MLASDISVLSFSANGTDLALTYNIAGDSSAPFDIAVYRSTDGISVGTSLVTHRVAAFIDRQPAVTR